MPYKNKADKQANTRRYWIKHPERRRAVLKAYYERRRDLVYALKARPCADCGIQYPPCVMDFDHLQDKKFELGSANWSRKFENILIEAAKCDVVCSNCHRLRTDQRRRDGK